MNNFPCDFQIKVIGIQSDGFSSVVADIVRHHFPEIKESHFKQRPSQQGQYLAISIDLFVHAQTTLDALYLELTNHPDVKWVL